MNDAPALTEAEWVDMLYTAPHPNDTLCGRLYAYERPEDRHLRGKIGYWRSVEKRMIRAQLAKEGWVGDWKDDKYIEFEISRRIVENHANDLTLREQQAAVRRQRPATVQPSNKFTEEEFERLAEHFAGANDPVSQSILAKAIQALKT